MMLSLEQDSCTSFTQRFTKSLVSFVKCSADTNAALETEWTFKKRQKVFT